MANSRNAVRAGAFIVGAALVSLAVVIAVSGPDRFQKKIDYVAVFDLAENLQGIRAGDEVRLAGVRMGTVREVVIDDVATPPVVRVMVSIPAKFKLRQGATMSVEALIGSANLNIDGLGTGADLPAGGIIEGQPSVLTRFAMLAPKIDATVEDVRARVVPKLELAVDEYRQLAADARAKTLVSVDHRLVEVSKLIDDLGAMLKDALSQYKAVAESARQAATNIGDFVGPGSGPATSDFKATLANLKDVSADVKTRVPDLLAKASATMDQISQRLDSLKGTMADLSAVMADARDISGQVRTVVTDNRGRIDRIAGSIDGAAANARQFTAEVLRRPSRILWRDDQKTQENLAAYFNARDFAEGAQQLNDAARSLHDALKDPRITDEEIKRRMDLMNATFDRFHRIEDKLWDSVKAK